MDRVAAIKRNLSIRTVMGVLGIALLRNGMCRSATHKDETPSVKIYDATNSWYDYSTSQGGDVIDMWCVWRGVEKRVAIEEMGRLVGNEEFKMKNEKWERKPEREEVAENVIVCMTEGEKERYYEVLGMSGNEEAALAGVRLKRMVENGEVIGEFVRYCRVCGWEKGARRYLLSRGLDDATIDERMVMVSDYWRIDGHMKKVFATETLKRAGLLSVKGYLIFGAHRIIIPYGNYQGEWVYLRGRYYNRDGRTAPDEGNAVGKFLGLKDDGLGVNTARRLYNVQVLLRMVDGARLYVTEGEMDAMMMIQSGRDAVAVPGVGNLPSANKLQRLRRMDVRLIPDNDTAGERLVEAFRERLGVRFTVLRLPEGVKDVSEWFLKSELIEG
jgi:hypothetical protein